MQTKRLPQRESHSRAVVSEKEVRKAIATILREFEKDLNAKSARGRSTNRILEVGGYVAPNVGTEEFRKAANTKYQPPPRTPPDILGKKFSYTDRGEPEGVVFARSSDGTNFAKIYSKATIKNPVGLKMKGYPNTDVKFDEIADNESTPTKSENGETETDQLWERKNQLVSHTANKSMHKQFLTSRAALIEDAAVSLGGASGDVYGRLLTIEELDNRGSWTLAKWVQDKPNLILSPMEKIISENIETYPDLIPLLLYKRMGLFVPTVEVRRPAFGSTEGAIDAATQGKCSFGIRDFNKEYNRIFTFPAGGDERKIQLLRVMNCAKAWTSDSIAYAIAQFVISLIVSAVATPAAGMAVETAMDAIPGYFLAGMYLQMGKKQIAVQLLITTTLACMTPSIVEKISAKFGITGWKMFLLTLGGSALIIKIAHFVTTKMFGEDFGLTASEVDAWMDSQKDGTVDDLMKAFPVDFKEIADTRNLMRKIYPAL